MVTRQAGCMPFLSTAEISLLSAGAGSVIALASARWMRGYDAKQAREATRARAVEESLSAAEDLLVGVLLFRTVRGKWASWRWLATGAQREATRIQEQPAAISRYYLFSKDMLIIIIAHLLSALTLGGVFEQLMDSDAKHYQSMVSPRHQRLIAALSPLRVGADKRFADAADRLAIAGGSFADKASSWTGFKHQEKNFRRKLQDFRTVAR
jgi:hypothetical protein